MMQCCARFQASRNAGLVATVSLRALYVDLHSFSSLAQGAAVRSARSEPRDLARHHLRTVLAWASNKWRAQTREDLWLWNEVTQTLNAKELLQAGGVQNGVVARTHAPIVPGQCVEPDHSQLATPPWCEQVPRWCSLKL
jgi:hypothetical protein